MPIENPNQDDNANAKMPGIRVSVPEKLDLRISLDGVPPALASIIEKYAVPARPSRFRIFLKDYLPALTPVATVVISVAVSIYTYMANDHRSTEALDQIMSEFGTNHEERSRQIAAIKLATYGEKALPAVKMVLGSDDQELRNGGVLVAEQMYRAETVDRGRLTGQIMSYYQSNDRLLRRGVLEWLVEMDHQLSEKEGRAAYDMIKRNFGSAAESCAAQDQNVALQAAKFLFIWAFPDSKDMALGMVRQCRDPSEPSKFSGARESALNAIPKIAKGLSPEQRDRLIRDDLPRLKQVAPELSDLIDRAIAGIQSSGAPR